MGPACLWSSEVYCGATMTIKYFEKPSEDTIRQFEERLDYYLAGINAKTKVVLKENPSDVRFSINGKEVGAERRWIQHILITTPEVPDLKVTMFERGIGENWMEIAWHEAHNIQKKLYKNRDHDDSYWELWNKLREEEE